MGRLLVTGAAGHLGGRVLHHLLDTLRVDPASVVAGTRDPAKLAHWTQQGITARAVDFDKPETLGAAFAGVERLLIISTDAMAQPGLRLRQHETAIKAAEAAGVQHVLYTSLPNADISPILFAPDHWGTEQALAASAIPGWTVLRNHWYFENLAMSLPNILASGTWYTAAGDGRLAHGARDDYARAAAAALADGFSGKRTLTLSGPTAYTVAELATLIGAAAGKTINVVQVPVEGLVQGMVGAGLPEPIARIFASCDVHQAQGLFGAVTGDVQALTGVAPQPIERWLAANKALLGL